MLKQNLLYLREFLDSHGLKRDEVCIEAKDLLNKTKIATLDQVKTATSEQLSTVAKSLGLTALVLSHQDITNGRFNQRIKLAVQRVEEDKASRLKELKEWRLSRMRQQRSKNAAERRNEKALEMAKKEATKLEAKAKREAERVAKIKARAEKAEAKRKAQEDSDRAKGKIAFERGKAKKLRAQRLEALKAERERLRIERVQRRADAQRAKDEAAQAKREALQIMRLEQLKQRPKPNTSPLARQKSRRKTMKRLAISNKLAREFKSFRDLVVVKQISLLRSYKDHAHAKRSSIKQWGGRAKQRRYFTRSGSPPFCSIIEVDPNTLTKMQQANWGVTLESRLRGEYTTPR